MTNHDQAPVPSGRQIAREKAPGVIEFEGTRVSVEYEVVFDQTIGESSPEGPSGGIKLHAGSGTIAKPAPIEIPTGSRLTLTLSDGRKASIILRSRCDFDIEGPVK